MCVDVVTNRINHIEYIQRITFLCVAGLFIRKMAFTTVPLCVLQQHNQLIEVNVFKFLAEEDLCGRNGEYD